uniref:Uncharacterized protein n=1 Tax=viral metagenome TaxID=1070528 RepID=A0A6M3IU50_9ZZZZ
MKPIRNNDTKQECGCTMITRRKKNNRLVRITPAEQDRIYSLYEKYYAFCSVNADGSCKEEGTGGHTKIGIKYGPHCTKCHYEKMTFIPHKKFKARVEEEMLPEQSIVRLPPPRLRIVTERIIREQNESMEDGYFDELPWDDDEIWNERSTEDAY